MIFKKRGVTEWTMSKLLTYILLIVVMMLVIYGVSTGGIVPLVEKMGIMADEVLVFIGIMSAGSDGICRVDPLKSFYGPSATELLTKLGIEKDKHDEVTLEICDSGVCKMRVGGYSYRVSPTNFERSKDEQKWNSLRYTLFREDLERTRLAHELYHGFFDLVESTNVEVEEDKKTNSLSRRFILYSDGSGSNGEVVATWENGLWVVEELDGKALEKSSFWSKTVWIPKPLYSGADDKLAIKAFKEVVYSPGWFFVDDDEIYWEVQQGTNLDDLKFDPKKNKGSLINTFPGMEKVGLELEGSEDPEKDEFVLFLKSFKKFKKDNLILLSSSISPYAPKKPQKSFKLKQLFDEYYLGNSQRLILYGKGSLPVTAILENGYWKITYKKTESVTGARGYSSTRASQTYSQDYNIPIYSGDDDDEAIKFFKKSVYTEGFLGKNYPIYWKILPRYLNNPDPKFEPWKDKGSRINTLEGMESVDTQLDKDGEFILLKNAIMQLEKKTLTYSSPQSHIDALKKLEGSEIKIDGDVWKISFGDNPFKEIFFENNGKKVGLERSNGYFYKIYSIDNNIAGGYGDDYRRPREPFKKYYFYNLIYEYLKERCL